MFSRVSPRGAAFEISHDSAHGTPIPPPPPRNPSTGPDARRHVGRPPTLNTAVPYVPGASHLATPIVTPSTLSSPFALSATAHATSAGPTPGSDSRGVSPDTHRLSGNFSNMTYNPREWASGRQTVEARQRRDVYGEPLQTPPPPYPDQRSNSAAAFSHPAGASSSPNAPMNPSPVLQHESFTSEPASYSRTSRQNVTASNARPAYEPRRGARVASTSGPEYVPGPAYTRYQSPPLNAGPSNALSFQVSHANTIDSTRLPPPPRRNPLAVDTDTAARFPYTRRSTSAGPTPTAGPSMTRNNRTLSGGSSQENSDWNPALPLPGPPPGPPPSSSRSRSAGPQTDSQQTGLRPRPPRLYIRDSNLAPIPATPSSVHSGVSGRDAFPLRIDTGGVSGHGKAPAVASSESQDDNNTSKASQSALARRSAVRGPAARSASNNPGGRSKSVPRASEPNEATAAATISANPWASALEQTKSSEDATLTQSSTVPLPDSTRLNIAPDIGQTHTPPITPSAMPHGSQGDVNPRVQQAKVLPTPPLSQKPLLSANSVTTPTQPQSKNEAEEEPFITEAMQRYAAFLKKEKEASSDIERLEMFTFFMQEESLIRKERYITAFNSDNFDLTAAKDKLFNGSKARRASEREVVVVSAVEQSPAVSNAGSQGRNDANWWKDYQPALSPIASMDYDEQSSRGRAPSRWWESAPGSQSDGLGPGVFRTKRESKYMSLSKQLLHSMENEMEPVHEETARPPDYPNEKANPETFGFYEEEVVSPPHTAKSQQNFLRPSTLDISRFITLPPPYPRHFPAVNNNHPDLTEYRNTVRTLSDLNDAKSRQSRHSSSVEALRTDRQSQMAENRKAFRATVQNQIADGTISYAEAADAERHLKAQENDLEKQGLQAEFDTLQDVVINPLHNQLNERIEQLGNCLQSLQRELFASAANQDPDQPVQEGDDVPELLEQLTQLKWLFEARETLHQELFNLLTQRNDAYKAIVALPYHQSNNMDKVRETDAFFDRDAASRHATFCAESLERHDSFLQFIDDNALRGIEMQSSAFWDITPGLADLLQKIPTDLNKLDIHIPDEELDENPTYQEHPQQYLYLLLRHAERSSYQFIEGQINLHCLVHEVKTSSLAARYRMSKAQEKMAGNEGVDLERRQRAAEGVLTEELKNRASMIEEQWQDALGKQLDVVKERVKKQLQKREAWDDIAAETEG